jgi:hypothetical protein
VKPLNLALEFLLELAAPAAFGRRFPLSVRAAAWGPAFAVIVAVNALLLTAFRQWEA